VIATGETHTVREFCELAFKAAGIELYWAGEGENERGLDVNTGNELVCIDPRYCRPTEVDFLLGDPKKVMEKLGWKPKVNFEELVRMMMKSDMNSVE